MLAFFSEEIGSEYSIVVEPLLFRIRRLTPNATWFQISGSIRVPCIQEIDPEAGPIEQETRVDERTLEYVFAEDSSFPRELVMEETG